MEMQNPEIQLIANVVVQSPERQILLTKYDPEEERWWLPGDDLKPFQHPDERAAEVLNAVDGLKWDSLKLVFIESFRGRRGWHVMFNYQASGSGEPLDPKVSGWFRSDELPRTMHGKWEVGVVEQVLESRKRSG